MTSQIENIVQYFKDKNFQIEYEEHTYGICYRIWNKYIMIYIETYDNKIWRIGIDPKYCFNKISQCSIIGWFPMPKREYKRFIKLLDRITNVKDTFFKYWYKEASTAWGGTIAIFGSYGIYGW